MNAPETPLADRIRPQTITDFVGQEHLIGPSGILRKLLQKGEVVSFIFWGPPGSGKTTLARLVAKHTQSHFTEHSAVTAKLEDVRNVVAQAKERLTTLNRKTILFLDEIHRFNKAQQDAFLPHVENGTIILIGATTENPSFEVIAPLLSRCKVLTLQRLDEDELKTIGQRGVKELKIGIAPQAMDYLVKASNGDARVVLNTLEIAGKIVKGKESKKELTLKTIGEVLGSRLLYDRLGEEHYNTISAFIKSMRASSVDAALYYLARMIEAGEDPLFIARRMVIFASEDIGMTQPTALVVANEVFRACETIGYPECAINLAHGVVYLATAKKDRSAYNAYFQALADVKQHGNLPIPLNLRNLPRLPGGKAGAPTKLMKNLGYGRGYEKYPPKDISLLPEKLKGERYYHP